MPVETANGERRTANGTTNVLSRRARAMAAVRREKPPELAGSRVQTNRPAHGRGASASRANVGCQVGLAISERCGCDRAACAGAIRSASGGGFLAANGRHRGSGSGGDGERRTANAERRTIEERCGGASVAVWRENPTQHAASARTDKLPAARARGPRSRADGEMPRRTGE